MGERKRVLWKSMRLIAIGYAFIALGSAVVNLLWGSDSEWIAARWFLAAAWAVLALVHAVQARQMWRAAAKQQDDAEPDVTAAGEHP
ncbi:hypothetical protein SCB71_14500 [Herbiconiux sp. KACC 21604]|uniref:hypothetical protein n=1 Tax=unclassified Herbiconiux TaxID=2618217 RepID=UPI001491C4B5|nr:hypothetical protein [Herbiconiux sp. SALV-R1]QJU54353.1 hypothetical protein HL652_12440 [Herbiconiux sp. SALV-R1]WPO85423.1 hypothetical protein SCB71_14500 [Herbiconiux sp. KACC 21604]